MSKYNDPLYGILFNALVRLWIMSKLKREPIKTTGDLLTNNILLTMTVKKGENN